VPLGVANREDDAVAEAVVGAATVVGAAERAGLDRLVHAVAGLD
jgi:hypothetical protein